MSTPTNSIYTMSVPRALLTGLVALLLAAGISALAPSLARAGYLATATSQFGEPGEGPGQFEEPQGIAVNEETGEVYVAESSGNGPRVQEFDAEGNYLGQLDGSEAPNFPERPEHVAVDNSGGPNNGDVYVAGRRPANFVSIFSSGGKYLSQIEIGDSAERAEVGAIAVDGAGNVFVLMELRGDGVKLCDGLVGGDEQYCVAEFSDAGSLLRSFPVEKTVFYATGSLAVDSNDDVYLGGISSGKLPEIVKFTPAGELLAKWELDTLGARSSISAVTVDPSTNSVFVDAKGVIEEFGPFGEPYGAPVAAFATEGLSESRGIAVDGKDGTVYATEGEADAVEIFKDVLLAEVSAVAAHEVQKTSAVLDGTVKRNGVPATYYFQYGETTGYGSSTPAVSVTGEEETVTATLTGLQHGATYHYQLVTENENGTNYGPDMTLKTPFAPPTVNDVTPSISGITRTTALLSGAIDTENRTSTYHVEYVSASAYGPDSADPYTYGANSELVELEAAEGDQTVGPVALTGLLAGVTYDYRIVANSVEGTTYGPDYTFTTAAATPPAVTTGAAGEVTQTTATLTGTVGAQGLQTSYEFEIGTSTAYGGAKLFGNAGQSAGSETISVPLQYLIPGVTYHYRLAATNADGTTYGQDVTFTTPGVPNPIVQPTTLPFIATPAIAFPIETGTTTTKTTTKALTRAQKLAKALKTCKKEAKTKRARCEKSAHKKYAPVTKKKQKQKKKSK